MENTRWIAEFRKQRIIGLAMLTGPMMMVVLAVFVTATNAPFHGFLKADVSGSTLRWLRAGCVALGLAQGALIRWLKTRILYGPSNAAPIQRLSQAQILALGLSDAVGAYGFLLYLVTGALFDVVLMAALALALMGLHFPRQQRWREYLEQFPEAA